MFSAFEEILDGEEDDFEHVFAFYDQVMQGDSSYVEREWYLAFMRLKIFLTNIYELSWYWGLIYSVILGYSESIGIKLIVGIGGLHKLWLLQNECLALQQ